jgi:molybdopterin-binding protein
MKAKLKGKITNIIRTDTDTEVHVEFDGKAEHKSIDARKASMKSVLSLKSLVADDLRFGATITIFITDEETPPVE